MTEFGGLKRAATTFGSISQREVEGGFGERVGTRQAVVEEDDAAGVKPFCDATHNDVVRLESRIERSDVPAYDYMARLAHHFTQEMG